MTVMEDTYRHGRHHLLEGKTMAKRTREAEIVEYLWPPIHRKISLENPRLTSVSIAAALLLFSAVLFGERTEATGANEDSPPSYSR
ncbi:MAG: hypothetical protein O2876_06445 [Proteobacteria bacterium]|nr:hypothetical protein [Pseudomonadota bacterium]